jgi:FlaA1/EpsC-like NDP-sugar epimerase
MIPVLGKHLMRLRNRHFLLLDILIAAITPFLALALRLDGAIDLATYQAGLILAVLLFMALKLTLLYTTGFYKRYWQYASIDELQQLAIVMVAALFLQTILFEILYFSIDSSLDLLPRSLPLLDGILSFLLIGGTRFSVRTAEHFYRFQKQFYRRDRVLIVGAGSAGVALAQQMQKNPSLGLRPVAFIDDDPRKLNLRIHRLPVFGDRYSIPKVVGKLHVKKVIIAMPTAPGQIIREILDICQRYNIQTNTLPGIHEILNGRVSVGKVREIQIEDLLRREPIQMDVQKVSALIRGQRVLVTGAGGSIGSELCRQILKYRPSELILLGHGENTVFNIQQELEKVLQTFEESEEDFVPQLFTFIADIRFIPRLEHAFDQFKPHLVFHAAAHKHVPMMELNAHEAITNNIQGTKNLLDLALKYEVEHFVMISTDKAVKPTSIMGASKRVAEMLVLQAAKKSQKSYVVVRFGNVLGSRGSVIPTFKKQIAEGGPVTVTHPDVCRYFMTIPEAVQLVLQASVLGQSGEVFMLDMGQPVKIVDLAKELIRLSGYELGRNMEIVFTGLRPGEKLFEELFIPGENYEPTRHDKLFVVTNASRIVPENLDFMVEALRRSAMSNDVDSLRFLLKKLVPGYKPYYSSVSLSSEKEEESLRARSNKLQEKDISSGSLEPRFVP